MQALSSSGQGDAYDPRLRRLFQRRVADWIAGSLGVTASEAQLIAGVALMAFDGFAMNARLRGGIRCNAATARLVAGLLGGTTRPAAGVAAAPRPRPS